MYLPWVNVCVYVCVLCATLPGCYKSASLNESLDKINFLLINMTRNTST